MPVHAEKSVIYGMGGLQYIAAWRSTYTVGVLQIIYWRVRGRIFIVGAELMMYDI